MKPSHGKVPISIVAIVVCVFAFVGLLYTKDIGYISSATVLSISSCKPELIIDHPNKSPSVEKKVNSAPEEVLGSDEEEDKDEFYPHCRVDRGKWVFNSSFKPLYSDRTCGYLERQVACVKNGRPDSDYRHWEWKPDECILPRFDPKLALEKLRGKRLMFVGDSLQRGQWESFVCMVEFMIPTEEKSMKRGHVHSVFKAKGYNATIEFYWAPYLVESNSDFPIIDDIKKRILRVDRVAKHAKHWVDVDILVFNTYIWWLNGYKIKTLWGSFPNEEEGYEELDAPSAYRVALRTWANWVDTTIDPNKTRVFFTTMSPTHMRSADWNNKKGKRCFNETRPYLKRGHWGTGSDKRIMEAVVSVTERMQVPITFINITQISEHRIDGHTSVYTETGGKLLTDEQKADPLHYADCIHWCLPGVPDTWNQLFLAYL
ncbi:hypothetical protein Scep_005680 [Stephania cephalantha]|uniref:Trichome birefringence-like N-terminal domain-containing protein n=1 Tax=Stephania cephalantha TaxID=152367 RepID=A0AAP0KV24_9MAGN